MCEEKKRLTAEELSTVSGGAKQEKEGYYLVKRTDLGYADLWLDVGGKIPIAANTKVYSHGETKESGKGLLRRVEVTDGPYEGWMRAEDLRRVNTRT